MPVMIEPFPKTKRRFEIVVVSHYYDSHGGGIERTIRHLISELAGGGDFSIVWAASDIEPPKDDPPARVITLLPMKSYNILERLCGVPWPLWGWKSLRRLRAAIRRADLVWLHDAPYM